MLSLIGFTRVGLGVLIIGLAFSAAAASRPNVILVMTDDQGYGDLSAHGNPVLKTPHLDRLHDQSLRLTDFHVAPMCTPTRGQLMTGVDALRNGAMNVSSGRTLLRREFPTMAEVFRDSGYRTAMFGKWHLGDNYPYRPQDRGFEESVWHASSHTPSASDYWDNDYFDDVYWHNGRREPYHGYCTDVFFREAMNWMKERAARGERFFCYIPSNTPHGPLFVPDRYREPYRDQEPAIASFLGMIANIDENMGRLENFLEETGLRENTVLIFMTDNGTATGESVWNAGMRGKKISLHDGGHRVPFFLRWPAGKLRPPGELSALTQCQDVLPTLIDLCGLKKPRGTKFDGISLAGLLQGKADSLPDRKLVVQFSRMNRPRPWFGDAAVLWKQWRLVSTNELYDVHQDPGQTNNLFEVHPEIARKLAGHYRSWWEAVAPRLHEFSPIHVGSDAEPLTMLTPCDWQDVFLDQQRQIRVAQRKNGLWSLSVERDGLYEFALRRWPYEADAAISAGLPSYQGVDGKYSEGKAVPIARAGIQAGAVEHDAAVADGAKVVRFTFPLKKGLVSLRTSFEGRDGKEICGAYYVYVRRVGLN